MSNDVLTLSPSPDVFPSNWASDWGEDRFGLWQSLRISGHTLIMRWIPSGRFYMGSPKDEAGRFDNEQRHFVIVSKGFWLGETTVTVGLWGAVLDQDGVDDDEDGAYLPRVRISWEDCETWIRSLKQQLNGSDFSLPTEAQWEYACRGGTDSPYWWGNKFDAVFANEGRNIKPEMTYPANPFGLKSMIGNVFEWCQDYYAGYDEDDVVDPVGPNRGKQRVLRGGSWIDDGHSLRSARRFVDTPVYRSDYFGFRLAGGG